MGEPPPRAMITSGLKVAMRLAPSLAQARVGSLGTSKKQLCSMPNSSSFLKIGSAAPVLYRCGPVTTKARFLPISPSSLRATGRQPFLMKIFSGARNQSMFSLLSTTVLIFSRCLTPTFSDTELPPQEPQPSVSDGARAKL